MLSKLFGRRPESSAVSPEPAAELHRPTLPPVDADSTRINALIALGASTALIADNFLCGDGEGDPQVRAEVSIIEQYERPGIVDSTVKMKHLRARADSGSGGKINVQPIVEAIEIGRGRATTNTQETCAAIAALYGTNVADFPIETGVADHAAWGETLPSLDVSIDGKRTSPLPPNKSISTWSVAQPVNWPRVAVRAAMNQNPVIFGELHWARFRTGPPGDNISAMTSEHRTMLEDFALALVQEEGRGLNGIAADLGWDRQVKENDKRHPAANVVANASVALMRVEDGMRRVAGLLSPKKPE